MKKHWQEQQESDVCKCGYLFVECECPVPCDEEPEETQLCRASCPEHTKQVQAEETVIVPSSQLRLFPARQGRGGVL